MTKARDRVINYVKVMVKFEEGRGPTHDYTASRLREVIAEIEKETKW